MLPPSQIVCRFNISRLVAFAMHLDFMSRYMAKAMNWKMLKRPTIWDGGSSYFVPGVIPELWIYLAKYAVALHLQMTGF